MSNMDTNSEYLHNYIKKVAKNEISNTDTSGVYTGVIKAVLPGHYEVTLNQSDSESTILAIAMSSVDIYEKDDYVYLLRAEISTTINYFIFGKVDAVQETFFNLTDAERFLAEEDSNLSAPDYSTTENSITIEKDANNTLTFDRIVDLGYFQFECDVKAQGNKDKKPFGFKITFLNEQDAVLEEFIFNSTEFYGQIKNVEKYYVFNSKVFHLKTNIDKDAFQKIVISKLEGDKYFTEFSADNVKIVAGSMLKVTAAYQNKIIVSNEKNYFDKDVIIKEAVEEDKEDEKLPNTVILTSNVYYNNKKLSTDALQYYWLLKDDTIVEGKDSYLEYAGNGWRCLNTMIKTNGINIDGDNIQIRLWDNKNNVIQLDKTTNAVNFSSFVNKVKCLVKYFDTFIESDIIDIYNYEKEEFSVELSSTTDSKTIAFKNDKIILKCDIINQNDKIDIKNYIKEYRWHLEDPDGDNDITPKDKEGNEIIDYNTLTIFDSAYEGELKGNQYKFEEGKTQGRFYCKVTLKPKADAAGLSEKSESVLVDSKAAEVEVTQNIEYKYYIANNHSVIFEETTRTSEGGNIINAGDWLINGDENLDWIGIFFDDEGNSKVFNDLTIFNNNSYNETEEWFVYYTQRTVWKEGGITFKTEYWTFPQIARSVIHTTSDGWKNHRIGNSTTQLNTFNQLTNNGTDDGVYYAGLGQLTQDENPDPGKTYYTKDTDGNYTPIQLNITWDFKRDKDGELEEYYKWDSEEEEYIQVVDIEGQPAVYESTVVYYKKDGDDYRKLEVNLNNFKAVNTTWPENISNPTQEVYENIDNKLFINATYIRSGTLEVKDKFYASIDQEDVRIAGFNVNETILESDNGKIGLNSDGNSDSNIAIWAGQKTEGIYPFQVTHGGTLTATGKLKGGSVESLNYEKKDENSFSTSGTKIDLNFGNIYTPKLSLIEDTLSISGKISSPSFKTEEKAIDNVYEIIVEIDKFEQKINEKNKVYYEITLNSFNLNLDDCYKIGENLEIIEATIPYFFVDDYGSAYPNKDDEGNDINDNIYSSLQIETNFSLPNHTIVITNISNIKISYYGDTIGSSNNLKAVLLRIKISGKKQVVTEGGELNLDPGTALSFPGMYIDYLGNPYFKTALIGQFNFSNDSFSLNNILTFWPIQTKASERYNRGTGIYLGRDGLNISDKCTIATATGLLESLNTYAIGTFKYKDEVKILMANEGEKQETYILGKENVFASSAHDDTCRGLYIYSNINADKQKTFTRIASDGLYTTLNNSSSIFKNKMFFGYTSAGGSSQFDFYYDEKREDRRILGDNGMHVFAYKEKEDNILYEEKNLQLYTNKELILNIEYYCKTEDPDGSPTATETKKVEVNENYPWNFNGEVVFYGEVKNKNETTNFTSDRNLKNSIEDQPFQYSLLFDKLKPVRFKYNNGSSNKYHTGLIAQDVEKAIIDSGLSIDNVGLLCFDPNENEYGLRYIELISMCIYEIQQNKIRIQKLENKIKEIKGE